MREWLTGKNIVLSAGRRDEHRRIRCASPKGIPSTRICSEHRSVPVPPDVHAPLEDVAPVRVAHVMLELKHVSVRSEDRSVRRIESLEQAVEKPQRNIGMVA